jgi:alpha-L-fucosidase 2
MDNRELILFLKKLVFVAVFTGLSFLTNSYAGELPQRMGLSHSYPTKFSDWENAYLSGNGKMGIIVFGNPLNETVIFADRGFNMAKTRDRFFAQVSATDINAIRNDCAAGNFEEANRLAVTSSEWRDGGEGNRHPGFKMSIMIPESGTISDYSRTCNFRTGEIIVKWTDSRGDWERKSFVSRKNNVIVQYITAPTKQKLNCSIQLGIDPEMNFPTGMSFSNESDTNYLVIHAHYPPGTGDAGYEGVVRVIVSGGSKSINGSVLNISGATSVVMLTRTKKYYHGCEDQWNEKKLQNQLTKIPTDYQKLLEGQIATHGAIYDRVRIDLNASEEDRALSNEELLEKQKESDLPVKALWERLFNAGRYYFLSSSSDQTPPDLLGIWTGDCNVGWGGFYHLDANLNLQGSGGNIGNMPEAMEGYFKLIEDWRKDFQINARKLLGCRGMLACGNSPGPTSGLMASINTYYPYQYATGEEAWLLYPFWEHYLITGDIKFLKDRLYPMLKDMGFFYEDFLTLKDKNGNYIFAGSVSPENQPANLKVSLLNNSDFDISGARFLLTALIQTNNILGLQQGTGQGVERWNNMLKRLPPYLINDDGALQEWSWPGLQDNYNHRHSSQLLTAWPYGEVSPEKDTIFFKAALKTLEKKDAYNYENAGHGLLHAALIAARLKNSRSLSDKLLRLFREDFYFNSLCSSHYNTHGVFCTDVCNTVPTIMMEMLIASSPGQIEFLPALPKGLEKGTISGVKGRNRITIESLSWNLTSHSLSCTLKSDIEQSITLIERDGIKSIKTKAKITSSPLGQIARRIYLKAGEHTSIVLELDKLHET